MNQLNAIGRIGRDPKMRTLRNGTAVLNFSAAIEARTKQGGEWVTLTTWVEVALFGSRAEALESRLRKGDRVGLSGQLSVRDWERDGRRGYSVELLNADVTLLGERRSERRDRSDWDEFGGASESPATRGDFGDDDIPFVVNVVEHGDPRDSVFDPCRRGKTS